MSAEADSKPLFNFSTWPTEVITNRYEELTNNMATCPHGEERAQSVRDEVNQAAFELIYRREQLAPAALALVLKAQLFTDDRQPATV